ncbi:MAG TPA: transferrin-binding protein-like solute binding protein, partial [Gallionella sp.]|nr:transferrin-binding protein-like solute binding protein [Gallionella sp.]
GAPKELGTTAFLATLDPATGNPVSATFAGGVNASVPALTPQANGMLASSFTGVASNGQPVAVTAYGQEVGLTYSNFGAWFMTPLATGQQPYIASAWAGGTQFTTTMPTTGTATYNGISRGAAIVDTAGTWIGFDLTGNLALTASFTPSGGAITGSITGITATTVFAGQTFTAGSFNDIALSGTITGNGFSGTAVAGTVPAGNAPIAIAPDTAGTTAGHFYGPAANEVTGVWTMSTPTAFVAGSFGAKQGTVSSVNNGTSAVTVPSNAVSPPFAPTAPFPPLTYAAPPPVGSTTSSTGISTANGMAGNATGRFYGPPAATTGVVGAP